MSVVDQVAAKAQTFQAVRFVLTLVAAPFVVLGVVVGVVWLAVSWAWAAVLVGVDMARQHGAPGDR